MLKRLNKGGELIWGIFSTLMDYNEQLLEFSSDWVLLKLSSIVWIIVEFSEALDSKSKLSGWILHDELSGQSAFFEGVFSKLFWTSCFREEDEDGMETIVSFVRRLCHNFHLLSHKYLL